MRPSTPPSASAPARWRFRLFEPSVREREPSAAHAAMPELVLAVSLLSCDDALAILHLGVLGAHVVEACA